uniref:Centromere protein M n=1 Tax=Sus scrofa TaxID=9823 RepID=A0A8D1DMT8_PIG
MSVLRPMDKLPGLNTATILLVGTEDALLQQLADSMLKEDCASELKVHLANSLPLPSSVTRPRIDLIVFVINLHSKHSLRNVEESLHHVDATFFLGKVSFLVTGAGRESHCSIHRSTVVKLAHTLGMLLGGSPSTRMKGPLVWRQESWLSCSLPSAGHREPRGAHMQSRATLCGFWSCSRMPGAMTSCFCFALLTRP